MNGDSKLDYEEFEAGMLNLGTNLTKKDIKTAFQLLDVNNNGDLEYHEFCESFDGYKRRGNPMVTSQQTKDISAGMLKLNEMGNKYRKDNNVKYSPPSLYGMANSGVGNQLAQRFRHHRNSENVSGFGSQSIRGLNFNNENHDDKYSTIEDLLSQTSTMRNKMKLPAPKNKNPELFIKDVSESGSRRRNILYRRNRKLTPNKRYGHGK